MFFIAVRANIVGVYFERFLIIFKFPQLKSRDYVSKLLIYIKLGLNFEVAHTTDLSSSFKSDHLLFVDIAQNFMDITKSELPSPRSGTAFQILERKRISLVLERGNGMTLSKEDLL